MKYKYIYLLDVEISERILFQTHQIVNVKMDILLKLRKFRMTYAKCVLLDVRLVRIVNKINYNIYN